MSSKLEKINLVRIRVEPNLSLLRGNRHSVQVAVEWFQEYGLCHCFIEAYNFTIHRMGVTGNIEDQFSLGTMWDLYIRRPYETKTDLKIRVYRRIQLISDIGKHISCFVKNRFSISRVLRNQPAPFISRSSLMWFWC